MNYKQISDIKKVQYQGKFQNLKEFGYLLNMYNIVYNMYIHFLKMMIRRKTLNGYNLIFNSKEKLSLVGNIVEFSFRNKYNVIKKQ